jgi:glycosyltransferase involved in cell wall biosynthesis
MPEIRFSIVITSYNQREFVREAVESALSQPAVLREVIVVDDGSTDGSVELLERYSDSIRLVCFPSNRGPIEARNEGAILAKGEFLVTLDGDDVLMPWALDVYERIIQERDAKILIGQVAQFKGAVPAVRDEDVPRSLEFVDNDALMHRDRVTHFFPSAFVVERRIFEEVGRWTPGIFYSDLVDLSAKLGYAGRTILMCSPATVFYRVHPSNASRVILPYLEMEHRLMAKERRGEYSSGARHLFERRAWFGRVFLFSAHRAVSAGLYKEAAKLMADGWSMVLAALLRKLFTTIKGRQPAQRLAFDFSCHSPGPSAEDRLTPSPGIIPSKVELSTDF